MELSTRFIAILLDACLPVRFYLFTQSGGRQMVLLGSDSRGDSVLLPGHSPNRRGCVPGLAWIALGGVCATQDARRPGLQRAARGRAMSVQRHGTRARAQSRRIDRV